MARNLTLSFVLSSEERTSIQLMHGRTRYRKRFVLLVWAKIDADVCPHIYNFLMLDKNAKVNRSSRVVSLQAYKPSPTMKAVNPPRTGDCEWLIFFRIHNLLPSPKSCFYHLLVRRQWIVRWIGEFG